MPERYDNGDPGGTTQDSALTALDRHALVEGIHERPFDVLGLHNVDGQWLARTYQPRAVEVSLHCGNSALAMRRIHPGGLFEVALPMRPDKHYLRLTQGEHQWDIKDPYACGSTVSELDAYLFNQGKHEKLFELMGANRITLDGVDGIRFAVWAPNAKIVSVIGSFNEWDRRRHVMRCHPDCGIWEIFIPELPDFEKYKFAIADARGQWLAPKSDPFAHYCEAPPGNASIIFNSGYQWQDAEWQAKRSATPQLDQPIAIYEVHAGSWRHRDGQALNYRELADTLIPYVLEQGFTHIELLPINEHPFTGSWGYQPTGLYAPTQRFGNPDDFRHFVDRAHQAGIAVIIDWVPGHFPSDDYALGKFDGTHLFEHADPRQGLHRDWNTLIYNFGRNEVRNFLVANATWWITEFHLDALRVDAVASMLYLDYSRDDGQWVPNQHGGNENLEAIAFLQEVNERVHAVCGVTFAEESTSWGGVSHPVFAGGLGFTYKWNMGWMHDTLQYMSTDSLYRSYHQNSLTFGITYAFSENFTLPFSHDEVVYGKGSMIGKMTGDHWQSFANLRSLYGYMYGYPGKKLLFMGGEFAQQREWSHDAELDWPLLERPEHAGMARLVRELNSLYRTCPALHQQDCDGAGFDWIDCADNQQNVLVWYRRSQAGSVIVLCHFAPEVLQNYRIGVDQPGHYREVLNTDAIEFGGSGVTNKSPLVATDTAAHNRPNSLSLTLPPLAVVYLLPE